MTLKQQIQVEQLKYRGKRNSSDSRTTMEIVLRGDEVISAEVIRSFTDKNFVSQILRVSVEIPDISTVMELKKLLKVARRDKPAIYELNDTVLVTVGDERYYFSKGDVMGIVAALQLEKFTCMENGEFLGLVAGNLSEDGL